MTPSDNSPSTHCETWCFPADHPVFAGHFPGQPIVPGALLLDRVVRSLMFRLETQNGPVVIEQAKFLQPIGPNMDVTLHLQPANPDNELRWRFTLQVCDKTAVNGVLSIGGSE